MKLDFYGLRNGREPDLEHELATEVAVANARQGQVVLLRLWLRTDGYTDLDGIEQKIEAALRPLRLR